MSARNPRLVLLLGGVALLAVSGFGRLRSDSLTRAAAGRLQAVVPSLTWQSPSTEGLADTTATNPRFELRNVGARPVRINSVVPQCACAEQILSADLVKPNESVFLTIRPRPMQFGDKRVAIELITDSPESPVVTVSLLVLGAEKPPFLWSLSGNLTFRDFAVGDEAEIEVSTVEPSRESGPEPVLESDLPFLRFRRGDSSVKPHGDSEDTFIRTTSYDVEIASTPPDDSFFGEVRVADPWRPDRFKSLSVRGESSPPIRVVPARLVVRSAADLPKTFLVRSRDPGGACSVRAEPAGDDNPFLVKPVDVDPDGRVARFNLGWSPGQSARPGVYQIEISSPSEARGATLSVLVQEE